MTIPSFDEVLLAAYEPMLRHVAKEIAAGVRVLDATRPRVDTSWVDEIPVEELAEMLGEVLSVLPDPEQE